jgi:Protein of unknown function (DUF4232)
MPPSRVVGLAANAAVASAVAALAVAALAGCASQVGTAGTGSAAPSAPIVVGSISPASAQPCVGDSLAFAEGDRLSPETGEHPFSITVTNRGAVDCWLSGYPQIRLIDASGQPLPMDYLDGGGYVTDTPPPVVLLRPGREGAFVFAKYRCDLGGEQPATHVTVALPGSSTFSPVTVPDGEQVSEYCGPNDPGDSVDISPFEPDIDSAVFHEPAPPPASSPPPSPHSGKGPGR